MKITSLIACLFLLPFGNNSSLDLHDIIQSSDHIIMAELTDVCDKSLSGNIISQLKGKLEMQTIDISIPSSESSQTESLVEEKKAILFLEHVGNNEFSLLFTLEEHLDSNGEDHYIYVDQTVPSYIKTESFINALESFIYNEQEISLENLQP